MAQPVPPTTAPTTAAPTTVAPTSRSTTAPVPTTSSPVPTTVAPTTSSALPTTSVTLPPSSSTTTRPPSSSLTTTSAVPSSSTTTVPPTTAPTTPPPSSSSTTTTSVLTITSTVPRPSLITSVNPSSRTGTAAAASATSEGKGGVGGSGLSVGALAGIIIGGVAGIAVIAFLVTHSMRKKARNRRTANRSSMFEPWPAPAPVALEDEPYEKNRYDAPSQAYPMQDQSYDPYVNAQQQAYHAEAQPLAYPGAQQGYPAGPGGEGNYNYQPEYAHAPMPGQGGEYPPQGYAQYPPNAGYAAGMAGTGIAGAGMAGAAAMSQGHESQHGGLMDGMMVRVKVGFVRTLEDELAITPGQQLYLHNQYDDGWSLCEDQNQNRGVVPVSCLEPWTEQHRQSAHLAPGGNGGMQRSNTSESLTNTSQRRSSLYLAQNAGNRISQGGMPGPGQGMGMGQGHY